MSEVESLLVPLEPLGPGHTVDDVSEILLDEKYQRFLCLPVVEDGQPIGVVTRSDMQRIYMKMYGRELHGKKSVIEVMNVKPLVVDMSMPMEDVSHYVTSNIKFPIAEDFLLTRDGRYCGLGHVVDLLKVMEQKLSRQNQEVAKAYGQLKASQAQLVQSEKMASLGQMVAGVAHEINTPLGYVKNNIGMAQDAFSRMHGMVAQYDELLEMLTSGQAGENTVGEQMTIIENMRGDFWSVYQPEDVQSLFSDTLYGVDQISEIVVNLKNFSRLDQAPIDNVNLNQTIDSSLLIAKSLLKNKAKVIKQYAELPKVSCSPAQINQVFLNLLTNAAQAIEGQGTIYIRTYSDGAYVYASVQDSGKGIPKESLKMIFDPFYTTKPIGEGTGLGLSIVFRIVNDHGGKIRVASEEGRGTRFEVSLPCNKAVH